MSNVVMVPIGPGATGAPGAVGGARQVRPPGQRVSAELASLDTGLTLNFVLQPSECDRELGANWDDAGVCEADPQPIEYRWTQPERRTYNLTLDGYQRPGGLANSVEPEIRKLKLFTKRVPGLVRAHRCLYTQGEQSFRCVVEAVHINVRRVGFTGGALQADVRLTLKELGK